MKKYIGIDPGVTGAMAIIDEKGKAQFIDLPILEIITGKRKNKKGEIKNKIKKELNAYLFAKMIINIVRESECNIHVGIEKVHGMPKMGVDTITTFVQVYGIIQGIIATLGVLLTDKRTSMTLIPPPIWKKAMMKGMGKEKDASIKRALELFPEMTEELSLKKSHNRAEALLIAEYLRSHTN